MIFKDCVNGQINWQKKRCKLLFFSVLEIKSRPEGRLGKIRLSGNFESYFFSGAAGAAGAVGAAGGVVSAGFMASAAGAAGAVVVAGAGAGAGAGAFFSQAATAVMDNRVASRIVYFFISITLPY